ncbi:MAG TPA: hypothetical protein DIC36_01020 [Gammaproteobacteria bacterium]|nr:hypothetical protein [Gammaproteobacteria bacterium]
MAKFPSSLDSLLSGVARFFIDLCYIATNPMKLKYLSFVNIFYRVFPPSTTQNMRRSLGDGEYGASKQGFFAIAPRQAGPGMAQ